MDPWTSQKAHTSTCRSPDPPEFRRFWAKKADLAGRITHQLRPLCAQPPAPTTLQQAAVHNLTTRGIS
eukprot:1156248-Pelagomonas_calceolata.AAC.19